MKQIFIFGFLFLPSLIYGQIEGYQHQEIEGFDIYIELDAWDIHNIRTKEAIDLLTKKLEEINNLKLKSEILDSLQTVKIFIEWEKSEWTGLVYHQSCEWLVKNGYIPEKEKSIEISNIENFILWTELNQPYSVLHELAHAYHHKVLGFSFPPIIEAYDNALELGLYDSVLLHKGNEEYTTQEAYARVNKLEYFAELTEAFLGKNDFFPFNREELKKHDIKGYEMLESIWLFEK